MVRENNRSHLLEAAEAIVIEDGAARLTLDAVARRAGVSKGGVLYHFPNKDALLAALVERMTESFEALVSGAASTSDDSDTGRLQAYVHACDAADQRLGQISCALLPALFENRALLAPMREFYRKHYQRLKRLPIGFEQGAIVTLALDGMWMMEMLGVSQLTPAQEKRIKRMLSAMAAESVTLKSVESGSRRRAPPRTGTKKR